MPSIPRPDPRLILMTLLCLTLGGIIALELQPLWHPLPTLGVARAASLPPSPSATPSRVASGVPPLSRFAAITARPLFFADRRSPATAEGETTTVMKSSPEQHFRVSGVALTATDTFAILVDTRSGKSLHVVAGSEVEGWSVRRIDQAGVTLAHGEGESALLPLQKPTEGETAAPGRHYR